MKWKGRVELVVKLTYDVDVTAPDEDVAMELLDELRSAATIDDLRGRSGLRRGSVALYGPTPKLEVRSIERAVSSKTGQD